jgi:hypothetical protein
VNYTCCYFRPSDHSDSEESATRTAEHASQIWKDGKFDARFHWVADGDTHSEGEDTQESWDVELHADFDCEEYPADVQVGIDVVRAHVQAFEGDLDGAPMTAEEMRDWAFGAGALPDDPQAWFYRVPVEFLADWAERTRANWSPEDWAVILPLAWSHAPYGSGARWLPLFTEGREKVGAMLRSEGRAQETELTGRLQIYRGVAGPAYPWCRRGPAWTLDLETAELFVNLGEKQQMYRGTDSRGGRIYTATVDAADVLAFLTDRAEEEVIVDWRSLRGVRILERASSLDLIIRRWAAAS